jgi:hypothetical protein
MKDKNTEQHPADTAKPLDLGGVRQRIKLIDGINMSDDLFNELADEFAENLVNDMGMELLGKLKIYVPMRGKYWQLQYVA